MPASIMRIGDSLQTRHPCRLGWHPAIQSLSANPHDTCLYLNNIKFKLSGVGMYLFLILAITPNFSYALHTDSKQKVQITADKSDYNYKTGVNIFEGNVKVDQGSTHLTADKLVTKNNSNHKIQEAIAYGHKKLAHYWTQANLNDPIMHGHAKLIKYYPEQANVTLIKDALVTQGENRFQGKIIHYNSLTQVVTVPGKNENRSVLVYNPEN